MSLSVLAQIASAATNLLFVVIIAIGYFMMIRLYKQMVAVYDRMLHFTEAESISLGRPLVVVYEDPQKLPNLNLVVQNVGSGPARDISFEFSDPIESSDGFVLSELPVFVEGMTSLAPGAKLTCYWDDLGNLLSQIEQGKTPRHVEVTTRYEDLSGHLRDHLGHPAPRLRGHQKRRLQGHQRARGDGGGDLGRHDNLWSGRSRRERRSPNIRALQRP